MYYKNNVMNISKRIGHSYNYTFKEIPSSGSLHSIEQSVCNSYNNMDIDEKLIL